VSFVPGDCWSHGKGYSFLQRLGNGGMISFSVDKIDIIVGGFCSDDGLTRFFDENYAVTLPTNFGTRGFVYSPK
jgi:hypothetical protein